MTPPCTHPVPLRQLFWSGDLCQCSRSELVTAWVTTAAAEADARSVREVTDDSPII